MKLERWNKWWINGAVDKSLVGIRRDIFYEINKFIEKRQVLGIRGLRRVGKTTLLMQIIDYLLRNGIEPYKILYFSFDEEVENLEDVIGTYKKEVLKGEIKGRIYILLDEIQKLPRWQDQLKIYYDLNPNWKFIITGSSSLKIEKGGLETLAGRIFFFRVNPLSFAEYLDFKGVEIDRSRLSLFYDTLEPLLIHYLKTGGMIEITEENNDEVIRRYFNESIIERIVYRDIPITFGIKEPMLMKRLFTVIASNPGMLVDYKGLGNDFNRDRRTIESYLSYLKISYLTFSLYNFSKNLLTSEKKLKKYYPFLPGFSISYNLDLIKSENIGKIVETLIGTRCKYFYRSPSKKEVDCIYTNGKIIPVEVKYSDNIKPRFFKGLVHFLRKFSIKDGLIITKTIKKTVVKEGLNIHLVPIFDHLLLQ